MRARVVACLLQLATVDLTLRRYDTDGRRSDVWIGAELTLATDDNAPAESIAAVDAERIGGSGEAQSGSRLRRDESQATMRAMAVVVIEVGVQDALELATAGDQDPVEALAPLGGRRACCATQAPLGCWVQPAMWTLRLPNSMKNRT
jgi:hypothetical protein